jgi:phosphoribosylformylglycinamidine cyclo-ligase
MVIGCYKKMKKVSYKKAGVDIKKGDEAVKEIRKLVLSTFSKELMQNIGRFGGFFPLDKKKYKEPILISSVDGVGTKLKVAFMQKKHDTVGQDIVNHCVNDILVHGAKPLFFLDYLATGKLSLEVVKEIIQGISQSCRESGCALIGGETAEMPDFYKKDEYDLAGCIVGIVEKKKVIDGKNIIPNDQLIGLASNGLHANGYSLARKVIFEMGKYKINDYVPELKNRVGKELLRVHKCYAKPIFKILEKYQIKGMAHITGSGIPGNLIRVLPQDCKAIINQRWKIPPIFSFIQKLGTIDTKEMYSVFNMGIGLILVVSKKDLEPILEELSWMNEKAYHLGEIVLGKRGVSLKQV